MPHEIMTVKQAEDYFRSGGVVERHGAALCGLYAVPTGIITRATLALLEMAGKVEAVRLGRFGAIYRWVGN